jgi:hypothetical protein
MLSLLKRFRALKIGLLLLLFSGFVFAQELQISPDELELTVGDTVQLEAVFIDSSGGEHDTTADWSVDPQQIASVNRWGLLVAKLSGSGYVYATLDDLIDSIEISVIQPIEPEEDATPRIEITQSDVEMNIGDSLQFSAIYVDTNETETDTSGVWSLAPNYNGTITQEGMFYAEHPGECIVKIELDSLMDWVSVIIEGEVEEDTSNYDCNSLVLVPSDTIITIGSNVQFTAYYRAENDDPGDVVDSTLVWSMDGMSVGDLSQNGLLSATATGYALVHAALGEKESSAFVIVADSSIDTTGLNTITITRDSPNPQGYSVMKGLTEGEIWTLSGLPYPMNVLNGGSVYFPIGSLVEDIRIHISLPAFAEVQGDSVGWNVAGVVGGIDFTVMINDTISEPYYFETPLIVSLIYKQGLLDKLGIDPNTLGLYFATSEGDSVSFDPSGITATTIDLVFNRIFSGVVHFSTLAIVGETSVTAIDDPVIPSNYMLEQNYPNPFNPVTTFRYTLPEAQNVSITIYDITGRQVETLLSGYQQAGSYMLKWNASHYSTGIYFYRLSAGSFTATNKMILIK